VLLAYSLTWPDRDHHADLPAGAFRAIWLIPCSSSWRSFGPANVSYLGHRAACRRLLCAARATPAVLSLDQVKWRFKRWRMRKRLRSVQMEQRRNSDDNPFLH
jgi:hypothetical protein